MIFVPSLGCFGGPELVEWLIHSCNRLYMMGDGNYRYLFRRKMLGTVTIPKPGDRPCALAYIAPN